VEKGVPFVDLDELFGLGSDKAGRIRFVTIRVGSTAVGRAMDSAIGVREFDRTSLAEVPLLLRSGHPDALPASGLLDRELFMVWDGSRLIPEELFARVPNQ